MNNSTIHELRPLEPSYTLVVPVEEELQPGIYITGQTNLFNAIGFALFDTLGSGYLKTVKAEKFMTAFGDSEKWNAAANFVSENQDNIVTKDYLENEYLAIANGTGYGMFTYDYITARRFITEDGDSDSWNDTTALIKSISAIHVTEHNSSYEFTDIDTNSVHHFNTPVNSSLSATIPDQIVNGFNLAVMNTGYGELIILANNIASTGTKINTRYSGAFIYKDNDTVYAVGNLTT